MRESSNSITVVEEVKHHTAKMQETMLGLITHKNIQALLLAQFCIVGCDLSTWKEGGKR